MRQVNFGGKPLTLLGEEIKVGDKAPNFTALKNDLSPLNLEDYKGKVVLISSVPSVDTGICALQTKRFNKEAAELGDKISIITVSMDLPFALGRFCATEGIKTAVTVSDHRDADFGMKYGFLLKELRLLSRGIVIVGADGLVKYVEYCPEIQAHPNYDAALAALKQLLA